MRRNARAREGVQLEPIRFGGQFDNRGFLQMQFPMGFDRQHLIWSRLVLAPT